MMSHTGSRITLAFVETLIGLCALGGGFAVMTGAFGFDQWLPVSWLASTPFPDYTIPGLVLLLVIGGGMLLAAATIIFVQREWALVLSAAMGLIMIAFEAVEVGVIDRNPQATIPATIAQQVLMASLGAMIFGIAGTLWLQNYRHDHLSTERLNHA